MKIKMKRSLAAILALVMALSLAACGGDKGKGGTDDGGDKAETITLGKYTAVFTMKQNPPGSQKSADFPYQA